MYEKYTKQNLKKLQLEISYQRLEHIKMSIKKTVCNTQNIGYVNSLMKYHSYTGITVPYLILYQHVVQYNMTVVMFIQKQKQKTEVIGKSETIEKIIQRHQIKSMSQNLVFL